jgi:hypothetical protein
MLGVVGYSFGHVTSSYPLVSTTNGVLHYHFQWNEIYIDMHSCSPTLFSAGNHFQVYYLDSANWNSWQSGEHTNCINPNCNAVYSTSWTWTYAYPRNDTYFLVVQCHNAILLCLIIINWQAFIKSWTRPSLPLPSPQPPLASPISSPVGLDQWCSCSNPSTCEVLPHQVCTQVCSILFSLYLSPPFH